MKTYQMSKCFEIVTPESAENGDFESTGVEYSKKEFDSLIEMAEEIRSEGYVESSGSTVHVGIWYTMTDSFTINYKTGAEKRYSFHPCFLSLEETVELHRLLKLSHSDFKKLSA